MKNYPSIPRATGQSFREFNNAFIFDKLDGSSMRSEWSKKRGWYKHGKRKGLIDNSNPVLLQVPDLFQKKLADPLARIAVNNKWNSLVVFYEFWGPNSLAGRHQMDDIKTLTVFDVAPNKRGILGPSDFRRIFEDKIETATCLDTRVNWTRGYVERVRNNEIAGITCEGVVAKSGKDSNITRAKAKTQLWIDKVLALYDAHEGIKIVES